MIPPRFLSGLLPLPVGLTFYRFSRNDSQRTALAAMPSSVRYVLARERLTATGTAVAGGNDAVGNVCKRRLPARGFDRIADMAKYGSSLGRLCPINARVYTHLGFVGERTTWPAGVNGRVGTSRHRGLGRRGCFDCSQSGQETQDIFFIRSYAGLGFHGIRQQFNQLFVFSFDEFDPTCGNSLSCGRSPVLVTNTPYALFRVLVLKQLALVQDSGAILGRTPARIARPGPSMKTRRSS